MGVLTINGAVNGSPISISHLPNDRQEGKNTSVTDHHRFFCCCWWQGGLGEAVGSPNTGRAEPQVTVGMSSWRQQKEDESRRKSRRRVPGRWLSAMNWIVPEENNNRHGGEEVKALCLWCPTNAIIYSWEGFTSTNSAALPLPLGAFTCRRRRKGRERERERNARPFEECPAKESSGSH